VRTQIAKWGNSLAIRLPGEYAKGLGLTAGMELEVSILDGGLLLRPRRKEYSLQELLAQVTAENVHEETDWGAAVGQEFSSPIH